jgi:hypothetical protein
VSILIGRYYGKSAGNTSQDTGSHKSVDGLLAIKITNDSPKKAVKAKLKRDLKPIADEG